MDRRWSRCVNFAAATAQTVPLPVPYGQLMISNESGTPLYVIFDWDTGMAEPSATSFDVVVQDAGMFTYKRDTYGAPQLPNFRAITAGGGRVGVLTL